MYPSAGGPTRRLTETKTINGVTIPEDTMVSVNPHMLHYYEKYYPNPDTFDPTRFSKENEQARPKCTFLAFSLGPRDCIGKTMALTEEILTVASLLKNFTFQLPKNFVLRTNAAGIIHRPADGMPLRAVRRT